MFCNFQKMSAKKCSICGSARREGFKLNIRLMLLLIYYTFNYLYIREVVYISKHIDIAVKACF